MTKVAGIVDWGIKVETRTDLFGETWQDGVLRFGKHKSEWLSETNRHYLGWLYAVKLEIWPQALLDLVWYWGDRLSQGKDEDFDSLVDEIQFDLKVAETVRA